MEREKVFIAALCVLGLWKNFELTQTQTLNGMTRLEITKLYTFWFDNAGKKVSTTGKYYREYWEDLAKAMPLGEEYIDTVTRLGTSTNSRHR